MNPEYKEISYHQLMKKIEVLNELNLEEGIITSLFGNKKAKEENDTLRATKIAAADQKDKQDNDARPEALRAKAAETLLRGDPTPENEAKYKAAKTALDATPDGRNSVDIRNQIDKDHPQMDAKSGILGGAVKGVAGLASMLGPKNLWGAYKAAVKNKMSRSEGIGAFLSKDSQKDTSGSRKMTQNDCAQLKLDTIPGKWPSVKVRYGCKN